MDADIECCGRRGSLDGFGVRAAEEEEWSGVGGCEGGGAEGRAAATTTFSSVPITTRINFTILYSTKDILRRKMLFCVAFLAVFTSIFSTLIINVFVKKGSLIFVKMSEDLQIDAVIQPTFRKS